MSKNLSELSGRKGLSDNLFSRLGELAIEDGTPKPEEMEKLAQEFLVGSANAFGTASFYDFLKEDNKGKKVYVCNGTACLCAGTQEALIEDLKGQFKAEEIGHMTCLGRCHENSAFHYDGKNYSGNKSPVNDVIQNGQDKNIDDYRVAHSGPQILTAEFPGIETYYVPFLEAIKKDPAEVLEEIKKSNVRGRGGAGFPMGLKLEFCAKEPGDTKFIICNADEGDPGAFSDRYLLEKQPHSVLLGMMVSGFVTGAEYGILYIRAEYPESVEICKQAIDDLRDRKLIGKDIK
ncbi:MAG: formate dehydrogenase, partial [Saprospiraceae bacterium]|nr:formate dehydrogenase [Saprospiraceae bacterium]